MNLQRRIALAVSLLAVGLGTGHFVQSRAGAAAPTEPKPRKIEQLSAGAQALPSPVPTPATTPVKAEASGTAPATQTAAAETCPVRLHLLAETNAMIALALAAPCQADARVVVKHGGLAVTARTSAAGLLTLDIPAMETQAKVAISFADGTDVQGRVDVPDMAETRRFGVQWMSDDQFGLQAYENGAQFGQPGNVSASRPATPAIDKPAPGGFLTVLGDTSVSLPMLAQVYTFPRSGEAEVTVEANVSPATCGREMLGEAITSVDGRVTVSELTLAMPDCSVPGGILVLKNLVPEMKLAAR